MPPRIRIPSTSLRLRTSNPQRAIQQCCYASLATAVTPAPATDQAFQSTRPIARFPSTQPPSHKPPEFRKSQLHRQYQSLLRSSPLLLLYQHNNLRAVEWMGIRRELAQALRKVDEALGVTNSPDAYADSIKIQIVQTGIFASALRVVEFYHPEAQPQPETQHPTDPRTDSSARIPNVKPTPEEPQFTHGLSRRAWEAAADKKLRHGLEPLLSGPLAVLSFPNVSPQHLAAALSILTPSPDFPAPRRKTNPSYHEPAVQLGLQKLMLLGARVEGRVFDLEGTKWVGGIQGGLDGLRAHLVAMLQGFGAGITNALEGAGRSLYFTMESRKIQMEDEGKPKEEKEEGSA